ncbi:MAG: hypothetical protein IH803_10510 [Nitrospirae bacterium]|nr:hypothetical protein [Nitrospirota bacterium]MEC4687636.1 hypothetical protein [Nitrospirota bacterium]
MKLPYADQLRVEREKILDYLLCSTHPDGGSKAEFFGRFGFQVEQWESLAESLRLHGTTHAVVKMVESAFGTRYGVDGPLTSPDGRTPLVRTVWILEKGTTIPRLITAYPLEDEP